MLALIKTKHVEFVVIPAADDVKPCSAMPDVIGRDQLFGEDNRVYQRCMNRREHSDAAR